MEETFTRREETSVLRDPREDRQGAFMLAAADVKLTFGEFLLYTENQRTNFRTDVQTVMTRRTKTCEDK